MIYGDSWLKEHMPELISPYEESMVNPASYNLRLGNTFLMTKKTMPMRLGSTIRYNRYAIDDGETIIIGPGEFMLATTKERIVVPAEVACFVHGRSSVGRMGLSVQNAGFVDPGFQGHITLELKNETAAPIELLPGYPIAQLVWMRAEGVEQPYTGKYMDQEEATGSRIDQDHDKYGDLLPSALSHKRRAAKNTSHIKRTEPLTK